MKRITILFTLFVLIAALTTSCNKKKLDELQESNDALKAQIEAATADKNVSTPINVTFTGTRGSDDVAFSFSRSFNGLDVADYGDNYVYDNGDGTYDIYIYRYTNEGWSDFYITSYDPTDDTYSYFYTRARGTYLQSDNSAMDLYITGDQNYWGYNNTTLNSINFNPSTNVFDLKATVALIGNEGDWYLNSTDNPLTAVVTFSGVLNKSTYRVAAPEAK